MKETTKVGEFECIDYYMATPLETHFMQSLSVLFPAGEAYFSRSIISKAAGKGWLFQLAKEFAKQEFYHSSYHNKLNDSPIYKDGVIDRIDGHLDLVLKKLSKVLPKSINLSATVILEEVTARLGALLLSDQHLQARFANADVRDLWIAHATDEVAHQYVAELIQREVDGFKGGLLNVVLRPLVKSILILVVARNIVVLNSKCYHANEIGDYIPFTKMCVKFLKNC